MHGQVWEWCQDAWHDNYENAPTDGSKWFSGRISNKIVIRGGSWGINPSFCRSAYRNYNSSDLRTSNIGFRVVCVAPRIT